MSGDEFVNCSAQRVRWVDLVVGASYDADVRQVREVLQGIGSPYPQRDVLVYERKAA
jgi:hypothetical protein